MFERYSNTRAIDPYQFSNMARELTTAANVFKIEIFKSKIKLDDVSTTATRDFITACTGYIRFWSDYAQNIENASAKASLSPSRGIPYQHISKFVIDGNDYTGILKFVDSIIGNPEIQTTDAIDDAYRYSVHKAFQIGSDSVADLVDSITGNEGRIAQLLQPVELDATEKRYFDNFRSNIDIYDYTDRVDLYKAVNLAVDYISKDADRKNVGPNNIGLYIAKLHAIVNYTVHSLVAYASRIYILGRYVAPYTGYTFNPQTNYEESVQSMQDFYMDTMKTTDEIMVRDMNRFEEFRTILGKWEDELGCSVSLQKQNPLRDALTGNSLYEFLTQYNSLGDDDLIKSDTTYRTRLKVRDMLLNPDQALSTAVSPRQDMITDVKEVKPREDTVEGWKYLGCCVSECARKLLESIKVNAEYFIGWRNCHMSGNAHYPTNPTSYVTAAECARLLAEFYRDFSIAILYKVREIEDRINFLNEAKEKEIGIQLKIDVPGLEEDIKKNNNIDTVVPDTTRDLDPVTENVLSIDVDNIVTLFETYDLYAATFPGMENDPYFTEAIDINAAINNFLAKIIAWGNRFVRFIGNASVRSAFNWVKEHQNELKNINISQDARMAIKKYKTSLQNVGNTEKIITALNAATVDTFRTTENKEKFIRSLYPSDTVANWFMSKDKQVQQNAKALYRKLVLFYDANTIGNVKATDDDPTEELNAQGIKDNLTRFWVPVILGNESVTKAQQDDGKRLRDAINALKRRLISNTGTTAGNNTTGGNQKSDAAPTIATPEDKTAQNQNASTAQQAQEKEKQETVNLQGAIAEIAVAVENVYGSTVDFIIEYYRTLYQYIQTANSMAIK